MPTTITINNISGTTPYDIYVCDSSEITCIYIETINTGNLPTNINVPSVMEGQSSYVLKIIDNNNCVVKETLTI
jgi:hypothetical protein